MGRASEERVWLGSGAEDEDDGLVPSGLRKIRGGSVSKVTAAFGRKGACFSRQRGVRRLCLRRQGTVRGCLSGL